MKKTDRLTPEELARLLAAPDLGTATGIRNAAMMVLMATAGLKVGELVGKEKRVSGTAATDRAAGSAGAENPASPAERHGADPPKDAGTQLEPDGSREPLGGLRLADIDWESRRLHVRRPGDARVRTVVLDASAVQLLRAWVEIRPGAPNDLVFVTRRGTGIMNRYVRRMLSEYGRSAGIAHDVRPSQLRRTFGSRLFERTGDIEAVARSLGLRHLASSLRYVPGRRNNPEGPAEGDG